MNRVISVILVVAASLFLSACKDSYTDELKVESNGIELADGTLINLAGQDAYNEQCASCHALDGNGTSAGSSLVGCATCGVLPPDACDTFALAFSAFFCKSSLRTYL